MDFGKNLKALRKEKSLTQNELSEAIKVSRQAVAAYEIGKREPKFKTLIAIAEYFNVTTDFLLGSNNSSINSKNDYVKENIKKIIKDIPLELFSKEVGNKTGILISVEKLKTYISGKQIPDNITLKILGMYAGVSVDFFYKINDT